MSMIQKKRNNRKKNRAFCPDHAYIDAAVDEFLALGGVVEVLEYQERAENFDIVVTEPGADDYLLGC